MTLQGDNIQHWCKEESLSVVIDRDDEALACSISIGADPPLSVAVRSEGGDPPRMLLSSSFELTLSEEVARRDEAKGRLEAMLERVAASRSALVDCRLQGGMERPAVEVVVTLHADGFTKQAFLTALAEIEKVRKLISLEVEAMSLALNMVSEMQSRVGGLVAEADRLASEAAQAAKDAEERPVPAGSGEAPPPAAAEPRPAPAPPSMDEAASAPGARFCASCGRQAKPEHRFCIGCGKPLDG